MTEERTIDLSIEVPGTPEEVWEAIATGPGITSWFTPMEVDGRVGGEGVMDFGPFGKQMVTVAAWDPPERFRYESGGDHPMAHEWLVEARDGGTCVVRLVTSGFGTGEEWDGEYEGMSNGWRVFLENLRLHLTDFRGRTARAIVPTVMVPGPNAAAWSSLCSALGVPERPAVGDRLATTGEGVPTMAGTVASAIVEAKVKVTIVRLDAPADGTAFLLAEGEGEQIACSLYLYLYGPHGEAAADEWTPWLDHRFQAVKMGGDG